MPIPTRTSGLVIVALLLSAGAPACFLGQTAGEPPVGPLALEKAYPVAGVPGVETSGLTVVDDELYTVADDHDGTIFRVELAEEVAILEPAITFEAPGADTVGRLDFEGITHDEGGNFYLASEATFRVLRVTPEGEATWVTPSLKTEGEKAGLFEHEGAYFEGIAKMRADTFALVAERQPRGLLVFSIASGASVWMDVRKETTALRYPGERSPDYSGLFYEEDGLYVLERAAHAVCRLSDLDNGFGEEECWSYAEIENDPRFHYETMEFGRGEGLAVDDGTIYVILDNNL
ncbi:MAG: SdiA-regulated domain-containing protein, partial [Gemmatimonadota bacterium]|nr:SdiA-regulated domain-containing protein [Gemmatimonadota bacterium]